MREIGKKNRGRGVDRDPCSVSSAQGQRLLN
jgi:hypothetical protein